jgi:hypothetical protein
MREKKINVLIIIHYSIYFIILNIKYLIYVYMHGTLLGKKSGYANKASGKIDGACQG